MKHSHRAPAWRTPPSSRESLSFAVAPVAHARPFPQVFAHFATAEHERERLEYFASSEGRDDLWRYCGAERRTLLEARARGVGERTNDRATSLFLSRLRSPPSLEGCVHRGRRTDGCIHVWS